MIEADYLQDLWPLAVYGILAVTLVLLILAISAVLGERHRSRNAEDPFESGIVHLGDTHIRFSAPYFVIALLFVIFDLEALFIYAWAVSFPESGWAGFAEISVFILILGIALFYLWRLKALDWGPAGKSPFRPQPVQGDSKILRGELPAPVHPDGESQG